MPPYLGKESLHLSHSLVQLLLCVFGSLQGIVSYRHGTVTVQASAVTVPFVVTATCTPARTFHTGSIARGATDLAEQVNTCLCLYGNDQMCVYV